MPDLVAEVIYAFVMPAMIRQTPSAELIQLLEITATHLTGFLGNGLYNLGGIILTLVAIRQGLIRSWIAVWGITAWILGLLLSASIARQAMTAAEWFTASSMVLSTSWMLILAHRVLHIE